MEAQRVKREEDRIKRLEDAEVSRVEIQQKDTAFQNSATGYWIAAGVKVASLASTIVR